MSEESDNSQNRPGSVLDSLKRVIGAFASTIHNRIELLIVELQEEGIRFVGALLLVGFTMLLSGLALIMGMFTVLFAVSEENRLAAAIIMTAALFLGAVSCAITLATRLKTWSAFSGTRAELRKDREWLQSNTTET